MQAGQTQKPARARKFLEGNAVLILGVGLLVVAASLVAGPILLPNAATPPTIDPAAMLPANTSAGTGTSAGPISTDGTIAQMQQRITANPNNYTAYALLGLAYQQKARETSDPAYYSESKKQLDKALQIKPDDYNSMAGQGALDLSLHNFREALDWGIKARNLYPEKSYAYGVMGDAQDELGDYDQAVATFQQMVNLRPDLSSYSRVSYARELHGDVPGAIQAMQQAITAGGPAAENTAWCRVQLGLLYFNSNDLPDAERAFNEALAGYPNYLHAEAGLAQVRWAQGRPQEAITLYKESIANVPFPLYVTALGDMYKLVGDDKDAKQQYDLVIYIYGLFEKNGVNIGPEKAEFMADHNIDLGTALTLAQDAGQQRSDVHTQDRLALVLYKNGRYQDALKAEQTAMRLGMQNALFYYHLGMIQSKLGQADAARASVQKALSINPYFSPLYAAQAQAFVKGSK